MAVASPKTAADRFLHALTGCVPNLDGDVTLEPSNYIANWRLDDLSDSNEPEGFEMGRPEEPDGFHVYMSEEGEGPSTMTAQNTEPIPLEEDTFYLDRPYLEGQAPRDKQFAARIAAPDAPEVVKRTVQNLGFAAGNYLVSYTWIDGIAHTALAPAIQVTLGLGQNMRITLPAQFPEGATHIGIWVSAPNGGVDTMRLQAFYDLSTLMESTVLLKGPWRSRKAPTGSNETYIPPPKAPELYRMKQEGGTTKAGTYRARVTRVDRRNGRESAPSPYSNTVVISEGDANKGIGLEVIVAVEGSYYIYIERNGVEHRLNTDDSGGTAGSTRPHSSERSGRSSSRRRSRKHQRRKKGRQRHATSGQTTDERLSSGLPSRQDLSPTTRGTTSSGSGTSRTSSSSGSTGSSAGGSGSSGGGSGVTVTEEQEVVLEDPDAPLDSVVPEGQVRISPGTYWVAISFAVRGEETVISPPDQQTITSSEVMVVKLPDNNNLLTNAQWSDRDANGLPDTWEFDGTGQGSVYYTEDEALVLDTLGSKTGSAVTPEAYQEIFINRSQFYAIGGKISAQLVSGSAEVAMLEYASNNSLVRSTTLINLPSTGSNVFFNSVFGSGSSAAGYTAFHDDTDWIALRIRFAGSTRQGQIYLHELYVNPGSSGRLRRIVEPLPAAREFANSDPPVYQRWNKQSIVGVMLPPSVSSFGHQQAPLALLDFESTDMAGFTLRQSSTTGTTAIREAGAAISSTFGYRIQKDTSATRYTYLYFDMGAGSVNRAVNFKVRIRRLPNRGVLHLAGIKTDQNDGLGPSSIMGVGLSSSGALSMYYRNADVNNYDAASSGIRAGDVLDIEMRIISAGTSSPRLLLSLGKNGSARREVADTRVPDLSGKFARFAQVGPYHATDPAATYTLNYDDIVVTETGNTSGDFSAPPEGFAYENPDRPFDDPVVIQDANFDSGSLPSPFTSTRNPTDSTTAVAVETGAKIEGTYGVRCADTGTTTSATAYITRTLSPTRTSGGLRARVRVVIRPGTGSIDLMHLLSSGGQTLGRFRLDSLGDLYAQTLTSAGALHKQTKVATGITNTTILTLAMVASEVGTSAGTMAYWLSVGGSGLVSERKMWAQHVLAPWSTLNLGILRVGICAESSASATSTLNVDSVRVTEEGEILFGEADERGNPRYQMYYYYPDGTPVRDDLGPKSLEVAVQPNETYTFAARVRYRDFPVDTPAYPCSFYGYDQGGEEFPLGSIYGAGGATGTSGWQDRALTFTVPEDCYLITMSSPGISSGELVLQDPAFSRGEEATREVYFQESGEVWAILDTETPKSFAFAPRGANPIENRWLDIGSVIDAGVSGGTTHAIQHNSADPVYDDDGDLVFEGTEQPTSWLTDPLAVTPRRYAHFLIQLGASSDLRESPTIRSGTPYVDYYARIAAEQVSCLLRDDLSEFDGGVWILSDLPFFRELSRYDVRESHGMVRRQRMDEPVGDLGGFVMRAYTQSAIRDIEENCLSLDFCVESRDYRLIVRFRDQVEFGVTGRSRKIQGVWCTEAEASVDGVEILEVLPINELVPALVAP